MKPLDEILVALAGPAVSLMIGIIGTVLGIRILTLNPEMDYNPLILELGFINIHYYAAAATKYGTLAQGGYETPSSSCE